MTAPSRHLAILWWLVGAVQLLAATYAFHVAKLYDYVYSTRLVQFLYSRPEPFMRAFVFVQYLTVGGYALSFGIALTKRLWREIRRRHHTRVGPVQVQVLPMGTATPRDSSSDPRCAFWRRLLRRGARLLVSGVQSIRQSWSRHNVELMQLRTLVEVSLQTSQAKQLSELVSSVWINRFFALTLVANCWFAPVVHAAMRHRSRAAVELTQSLVDAALDITYAMLIPLAIFYPYYRDFNQKEGSFPWEFFYLDAWYVGAVTEMRHVLVTSWLDFLGKAMPSLSLVMRLVQIERLLTTIAENPTPTGSVLRTQVSRACVSTEAKLRVRYRASVLSRVLNALLACWGVVILSLHLHVSVIAWRFQDSSCLRELRPWGRPVYTCAVVEVSCAARQIVGREREMHAALQDLDAGAVHSLIVSHCPALEMPPRITAFSSVTVLKIYNSTISAWREEAALTDAAHPLLQSVFLPLVNMSEIPIGLRSRDFPRDAWDLEFSGSNITTLPPELEFSWTPVTLFIFEWNPRLTEIPPVLARLPKLTSLLLSGNGIAHVPDRLLSRLAFRQLKLTANPLQTLPLGIGRWRPKAYALFSGSNISEIPLEWRSADTKPIRLEAAGTPLCDSLLARANASSANEVRVVVDEIPVICQRVPAAIEPDYPMALEARQRRRLSGQQLGSG
ncbi:hypothetical protein P43SY_007235 [Pythium insidiosum]|uniref:Uncharacterized protein n=1 Tax=Pythium insidiosum TaxID=114742 RepID=A0AAD5LZH0_PYTIN|nr:hypothetical protein P43SY_007235 [Pythium insidiosum]